MIAMRERRVNELKQGEWVGWEPCIQTIPSILIVSQPRLATS